jgi:RNA polymerase sigma-70 factor (ECF subfamily)
LTPDDEAHLAAELAADTEMLQAIGRRDVAAFQAFHRKFNGLLYVTIHRVLNDHQDTEDIMQEVLVQIWQKAHLYEPAKGKPLTWVTTMARNRAIDRIRAKQRRSRLNDEFELETKPLQPEFVEDTSDLVTTHENDKVVQSAVLELTPDQREAIQLAYFSGLTQSEIGQLAHLGLGQAGALWAEVDHPRRRRLGGPGLGDARSEGIDQHDHARPAAKRAVVNAPIAAFGEIARVPSVQRQLATLRRAPDHAERRALGDEFGEQADDIDAHGAARNTVRVVAGG